jgi:hypothetical protein
MSDGKQATAAIYEGLIRFKRKYFVNRIIRGTLLLLTISAILFLAVSSLEYIFWFNNTVRFLLLCGYVISFIALFYKYILISVFELYGLKKGLDNEEAAKIIGKHFDEINDKLLNIIQLSKDKEQNELVLASIEQKASDIRLINFPGAVNFHRNVSYLKFFITSVLSLVLVLVFIPQLITESSTRIIKYSTDFTRPQPFEFEFEDADPKVFLNEDYTFKASLKGDLIPETVSLLTDGRIINLVPDKQNIILHTFKNVQFDASIRLEALGIKSDEYQLRVVERPTMRNFQIEASYPAYTGKSNEIINNNAYLNFPEGSSYTIKFATANADEGSIVGDNDKEFPLELVDNQLFKVEKEVKEKENFEVIFTNDHGRNKDELSFNIVPIKDEYPKISADGYLDTVLYREMLIGGRISDDYGITSLQLFFKTENSDNYQSIMLDFDPSTTNQSFFYNWNLKELKENNISSIEYYIQVSDNDQVNGLKSTSTPIFQISYPDKKALEEKMEKSSENAQNSISKSLEKANKLNDDLNKAKKNLAGKKNLDWEDKALMKDILKQKKALEKELQNLLEENRKNKLQQEEFDKTNEAIREKSQQLQELMEDLLDEETKKLYDELKQLLEEEDKSRIDQQLDKISDMEMNIEEELERTLELFKRMKLESKLNEAQNDLKELQQEQEELQEQTENKDNDLDEIKGKQEDIGEKLEDLSEKLDDMRSLNNDLKRPEPLPDTDQEEQNLKESQQNTMEELQKGNRKKSSKEQGENSENMQQLAQKLAQMQSNMEIMTLQENIQNLRDILDNLVKLSFEQETLMKSFRTVNQSDPRFISLSQKQLKIKDDARIIEDSLMSLAGRVFQIQSFVTREVNNMNGHMQKSIEMIRDRKQREASAEQQLTMTSVNNLANMLDDILSQMQMQMADATGQPSGKPQKGNQPIPSLSELQQQLNQKIQQLKNGQKSGRELSEELAKLAAEQERLRQLLENEGKKAGNKSLGEENGGENGNLQKILKEMEETELDLVNKELTKETIQRQKDILTRLLKAEESMRERDQDDKREGETAKNYENELPKAFEDYIRLKEKQIELLQTVPLRLNPYFKNEVNEYFRRLESTQ